MTRKDYEIIAEAIRNTRAKADFQGKAGDEATIQEVARSLAQLLKFDNVRFDEERFLVACGVN